MNAGHVETGSHAETRKPVETGNHYDKYASTNPIEMRLMRAFLRRLDGLLPTTGVTRILEVGVGEGHLAGRIGARYPKAFLTGVDLVDDRLGAQWRDAGLPALHASADRLPFPDRSFDLVLAVEVLEHLRDPDAALSEIARVARDRVVLTVPWEPWWRMANVARGKYVRNLGNTPGHIQHWSRRAFADTVGRHLTVTTSNGSFPWTLVAARG